MPIELARAESAASAVTTARWAPAKERVYDYVRRAIIEGQLVGGTFLEEERVSLAVGVSRTPVREAFQQLQSDRLIDLLPRRGALVRAVTVQEFMEVYETRVMIETHALRKLCDQRQPPPAPMVQALEVMQRQPGDLTVAHVQLNTAFHRALVAAADNSVNPGTVRRHEHPAGTRRHDVHPDRAGTAGHHPAGARATRGGHRPA